VFILILIVAAALLFASRHELPAAWSALRQARRRWLVIGVAVSVGIMVAFSLARKYALAAFGIAVSTGSAIGLGFTAHALNTLGKSGGMAGAVVYRRHARQRGLPVGVVTAAYVLSAVLVNIAFGCVMLVALALLVVNGGLSVAVIVAAVIFVLYLAGVLGVFFAATRSQRTLRWLYSLPHRLLRSDTRHEASKQANRQAADELHVALNTVKTRPRAVFPVLFWLLIVEALNITTVAVALAAYGQHKSIALSIIAYAVSGLFTIIDPLPVGLADASLAAVLIQYDVPGAIAAVVVVTQRVIEIWLPLAIGAATSWLQRTRDTTEVSLR
jgi:uncharacterized protein (TIRG00374 family)